MSGWECRKAFFLHRMKWIVSSLLELQTRLNVSVNDLQNSPSGRVIGDVRCHSFTLRSWSLLQPPPVGAMGAVALDAVGLCTAHASLQGLSFIGFPRHSSLQLSGGNTFLCFSPVIIRCQNQHDFSYSANLGFLLFHFFKFFS